MTRIVPNPGLGSELDAFLFAPIGEEGNGMLLSVVSALARLDVDPRQEAAQLARLPAATATRRLTSLLEALPDTAPARQEPATVAARLVGLLCLTWSLGSARRVSNSPSRRQRASQTFQHADLGDCHDAHPERPMDRRKPSTAGAWREGAGSDPSTVTPELQLRP